jgi:hypothetical protein
MSFCYDSCSLYGGDGFVDAVSMQVPSHDFQLIFFNGERARVSTTSPLNWLPRSTLLWLVGSLDGRISQARCEAPNLLTN